MLRYRKVEEYLKKLLTSSEYAVGDRIPSERDLAERLRVNRLTVRRAVNNLIRAGLLEGNGTGGRRVAAPRMVRPLEVYRSIGMDRVIAGAGGTPSNKLLHFEIAAAGPQIAAKLKIDEDAEVIVVRRIWAIDSMPFCLETSYLAAHLVPGLCADDLVAGQSLYALLRTRYGHETVNAERTITVAHVNEMEARHLNLEPGAAGLALRLSVDTVDGRPIEYMVSINNPNMVAFHSTMTGQL